MSEITTLAQYGVVGICLALIVYSGWRDKILNATLQDFSSTINNHIAHNTDAKIKLTGAITRLAERVDDCPHNK